MSAFDIGRNSTPTNIVFGKCNDLIILIFRLSNEFNDIT